MRSGAAASIFLRDDSFDKPAFQLRNGVATPADDVPLFKIQQYGATVGGPFKKDTAFYFVSLERRTAEDNVQVTIPDTVRAFVSSLNRGYDLRTAVPLESDEVNTLGKFTFNLSPRQTLNLTYLYDDRKFTNKQVSSSDAGDAGFDDIRNSYYATANLTSLFGSRVVNEFRFNRSLQRLDRVLQADSSGKFVPELDFPSIDLGTAPNVPQGRIQKNWIVSDTMSVEWGNHSLKWGGEANLVEATADANITFNGSYRFPSDTATVPDRYSSAFNLQFLRGESTNDTFISMRRDVNMYAGFINDTWRVTPQFTINMGLRYDLRTYVDVDGSPSMGGRDPFAQPGFSRNRPEEVWVAMAAGERGSLGVDDWRPAPEDRLDLSPRFGFSWDLLGTGRAVVRASYGIFHDRIDTSNLRGRVLEYEGLMSRSAQSENRTLLAASFPNIIPSSALTTGAGGTPDAAVNTIHTPYTQQMSGGFQYAITPNTAFSADYMHILGLHFSLNGGTREPNSPLPGATSAASRVCPLGDMLSAVGVNRCVRIQIHDYTNRLHINTLSFRLERRFTSNLGFLAGYTLGSAKNFDPRSQWDLHNPIFFGATDNDVRHRITSNVIYTLPYGVQASSIITANSAPPYDHQTGLDDNFDFTRDDRPAGVEPFSLRGDYFFQMDLRLTKRFAVSDRVGAEFLWEMFNVWNTRNLINYNGIETASTFRKARGALSPFQAQLGVKLTF